ncbi:hypothetical protein DMN77_18560 [Paenibacillus sp. 79R4]|uniref:hypothetical protein n=1 Tax=Paenibacillus sp. 79R4 TaxID=2212847 RepID=UPI0015BD0A0C|nr:hypothetical protein [Paenibacillus sp. 79R4]NWL89553.1 hypothetical protein [Paenibacillus sp. 79R4]
MIIVSDKNGRVLSTHAEGTADISEVNVAEIPKAEELPGKVAELCIKDGELYYSYYDVPLTNGEKLLLDKLTNMEAENTNLKQAVAELTMMLASS